LIKYIPDSPGKMLQHKRFRKRLRPMPQQGIKGPSSIEFMAPGNRMVFVAVVVVAGLVDGDQDLHLFRRRVFAVIVPLVFKPEGVRKPLGRGVGVVYHGEFPFHRGWMAFEISAREPPGPGPVVCRIGSRVDAHKTFSRPDEAFESSLLLVVEHIARGVQKHNGLVWGQALIGKKARVFGGGNDKALFAAKLFKGFNSRRYGVMPESGCL